VTVDTPDLYGGAAVTSKNLYRKQGLVTWTEVAGAATFSADPYTTYDIVFGIGATDDDDEPFGCKISWTVPCESSPTVSATLCPGGGMVDDAIETDLTPRVWDPEDGTVITDTASIDIDEGDVFNLKTEWQSSYEEDYGNRFCGKGNLLVVTYNTSHYTDWTATDLNGNAYPTGTIPTLHSATAGCTDKGFEVPVLKSNALWTFYLVADASGSGKEPSIETNVTLTLYDSNWFINNDVTPPSILCGWEDEDGADTGSTDADTHTIYIAA